MLTVFLTSILMKKFLLLAFFASIMLPLSTFAYPGCPTGDIVIGGQAWASCNALTKNKGSAIKSGWFSAGDTLATFLSYNGIGSRLEFQRKTSPVNPYTGPCANGYKLPNRGEWETAIYYSRLNNMTLATLLSLPYNGSYRTYRDSDGDIMVTAREDVLGSYWTSTYEDIWGTRPVVLHLGSTYSGYRMDGTDGSYREETRTFQYGENGLEIVGGEEAEIANVRCIRR